VASFTPWKECLGQVTEQRYQVEDSTSTSEYMK
jgi:hypothetical protein